MINVSEDRLLQVFENILDNAVSFSPRGAHIAVKADADKKWIIVSVRVHGPGIAEENLGRILDRFCGRLRQRERLLYRARHSESATVATATPGRAALTARPIASVVSDPITVYQGQAIGVANRT